VVGLTPSPQCHLGNYAWVGTICLANSVLYSCETFVKAIILHKILAASCTRMFARTSLSLSRSVHRARKLPWLLRARIMPRSGCPLTTASTFSLCSLHYHCPRCSQRRLAVRALSMLLACSQYHRREVFAMDSGLRLRGRDGAS
jgi:hypothetical protein